MAISTQATSNTLAQLGFAISRSTNPITLWRGWRQPSTIPAT